MPEGVDKVSGSAFEVWRKPGVMVIVQPITKNKANKAIKVGFISGAENA